MPEFIADTDGTVNGLDWDDLSPLARGYIEAMLFTETVESISMVEWEEPENQEDIIEGRVSGNIPGDSGFGDIHPDTLTDIIAECGAFHVQARDLLREAYERGYEPEQAGRDLWFTRNGHGVGFWDRSILDDRDTWRELGSPCVGEPGWEEYAAAREQSLGKRLSKIAQSFGEVWSSFNPDPDSPTGYGYVYLS